MHKLRKRQVHLDFHTNGTLTVGTEFSKEQFQAALKAGARRFDNGILKNATTATHITPPRSTKCTRG